MRFRNSNIFSYALHNNKIKVVEYLLQKDMIDIRSCLRQSPTSLNSLFTTADNTPSTTITNTCKLPKTNSYSDWSLELEHARIS